MSEELKNAIVLIIAVSLALNFIAPSLIGNSAYSQSSQYHAYKPASRDIIDTSYSGHLGQTPTAYDNPFPGLFPDSYKDDRVDLYQPVPQFETCGLCTCFTGRFSERPISPINQYTGELSEASCKLTCQKSSSDFIAFSSEEIVACDYASTR